MSADGGMSAAWRGPVIVTGTDTGVGKTVVTAAIAAAAIATGLRVSVLKPGQAGTAAGDESDVDIVRRLAAPQTARTLMSYPDPLAPHAAARVSGLAQLDLEAVAGAVRADAATHDLVLIEGAGGLLVPMGSCRHGPGQHGDRTGAQRDGADRTGAQRAGGDEPWTVADLAALLSAPAVVVTRAGLGTLNHTALTLEALRRRDIPACVVIGAWPDVPELVHLSNFVDLAAALAGIVPEGVPGMEPGVFRRSAPGWFTPLLYGAVDDVREWAREVA